jgi:hypothetical protein
MGVVCFLRILCLGHCALLVGGRKNSQRSRRQRGGRFGTTAGKWLGALLGMLVLAGIGAILGAVVWYTGRPRRAGSSAVKLLCSRLTFR